jgi:hypothetical protein
VSKWFREARTADHSFSSISFQRLTKIARHFKLLSVPHSECSASIASKLWKPQELPMASLKRWINSSFSVCHRLKKVTFSVWTWVNYNLAIKKWRFYPLKIRKSVGASYPKLTTKAMFIFMQWQWKQFAIQHAANMWDSDMGKQPTVLPAANKSKPFLPMFFHTICHQCYPFRACEPNPLWSASGRPQVPALTRHPARKHWCSWSI